jgi:2-polyprenyl-3-methyl-5-hydroxy-6-metoxy-1,4-benzoquinol methylase
MTAPRRLEPEVMDQPDLDPALHRQALAGLARINAWSGSARILWRPIAALARQVATRPLRVLDLATGGGDVPLRLWRRAQRAGLNLDIEGCDRSPEAVQSATEAATAAGAAVRFTVRDALADGLPDGFDVVACSLFLHHLTDADAVKLLRTMAAAARQLVLVNDLRRSAVAWWWTYFGTRLLTRSPVVHVDGPRSVAAAFTMSEASALAAEAGLTGATVGRRWPFRYLLSWQRAKGC